MRGDGSLTGARSSRRPPRWPRATSCATTSTGRTARAAAATRRRRTPRPSGSSARGSRRRSRTGATWARRPGAQPGRRGRARAGSSIPNDGTRDYLVGRRGSAVSIGLLVEGRPVLGVVFAFAYPTTTATSSPGPRAAARSAATAARSRRRCRTRSGPLDVVLVSSRGDRDPETQPALRGARALPRGAEHRAPPGARRRGRGGGRDLAVRAVAPGTTAAGHALLRARGRACCVDEHGREVAYDADGDEPDDAARSARVPRWPRALASRGRGTTLGGGAAAAPRPARLERGRAVADSRRCSSRAQGCLFGPGRGRQPGQPRRVRDGGRDRRAPIPDGAARARRRRPLGHARRPADRRLRDGAGAARARSWRRALRAGRRARGLPRVVPQPGRSTSATPRAPR